MRGEGKWLPRLRRHIVSDSAAFGLSGPAPAPADHNCAFPFPFDLGRFLLDDRGHLSPGDSRGRRR
jgi:hypothetical protein